MVGDCVVRFKWRKKMILLIFWSYLSCAVENLTEHSRWSEGGGAGQTHMAEMEWCLASVYPINPQQVANKSISKVLTINVASLINLLLIPLQSTCWVRPMETAKGLFVILIFTLVIGCLFLRPLFNATGVHVHMCGYNLPLLPLPHPLFSSKKLSSGTQRRKVSE